MKKLVSVLAALVVSVVSHQAMACDWVPMPPTIGPRLLFAITMDARRCRPLNKRLPQSPRGRR
jgi:hypothetical protein